MDADFWKGFQIGQALKPILWRAKGEQWEVLFEDNALFRRGEYPPPIGGRTNPIFAVVGLPAGFENDLVRITLDEHIFEIRFADCNIRDEQKDDYYIGNISIWGAPIGTPDAGEDYAIIYRAKYNMLIAVVKSVSDETHYLKIERKGA